MLPAVSTRPSQSLSPAPKVGRAGHASSPHPSYSPLNRGFQDAGVLQPSGPWAIGLGVAGLIVGGIATGGIGVAALGLGAVGAALGTQIGNTPNARVAVPNQGVAVPDPRIADLSQIARAINILHGYNDIATLAIAEREDGTYAVYTQRGYNATRECAEVLERFGIPPVIPCIESSDEAVYNMHAEMLAISEWLANNQPKPKRIGASRGICRLCHLVLQHLGVHEYNVSNDQPPNWASPYWFNGQANPLATIPNTRKNKRDNFA